MDTKTKENIVDAINEVYRTSGVSPEDIAKAVEDYLAEHPAASASMRVEDGYIQFSGDGENWDNVIALADLKGPKGDTGATGPQGPAGAGMGITGATVGQIIKVKAVNSDGCPTAWEPVDMPAGGGGDEWELINTISITEPVHAIDITIDSNGDAFSLKKKNLHIFSVGAKGGRQFASFHRAVFRCVNCNVFQVYERRH